MTYEKNVEAAAAHLRGAKRGDDHHWGLARLTFESTTSGNGVGQPERVPMSAWCAAVVAASGEQFSASVGAYYKAAWKIRLHVSGISWGDAYWQARGSDPKREFEQGGQRAIAKASPEVKRETFKTLAADADIIADQHTGEIVGDLVRKSPAAPAAAMKALDEKFAAASTQPEPHAPVDASPTKFIMLLRRIQQETRNLTVLAIEGKVVVSDAQRDGLLEAVTGIRAQLDVIEQVLNGQTLDMALEAILGDVR